MGLAASFANWERPRQERPIDRNSLFDSWIETNQWRIKEASASAFRQLMGRSYSELPSEVIHQVAVNNLPVKRFGSLEDKDYYAMVESAIRRGASINDVICLCRSFYSAMELLARTDQSVDNDQRKFMGDRIEYISRLVASNLSTTYMKCVVARSKKAV